MNKVIIGIVGFILLLVGAALVGPGFIDWNQYKAEIADQAERFTGRKLQINGNIEITVLPAPALIANDVRLSNVEGAAAEDIVSLKSLQVRVALGPLLSGQVKVQTVQLIDPVIQVQRFANGKTNVEMILPQEGGAAEKPQASVTTSPASPATSSGSGEEAAFSLDNFVVENATVIYRDDLAGSVERIDQLNATFAAASLQGPFESVGNLTARGFPLDYTLSVGKIIEQRTAPISLTVGLEPGETKTTVSGAIVGLDDAPHFKGVFKATGTSLAGLIQSLGPNRALPGMLGQNFGVEGEVEASQQSADIQNLVLTLGKAVAKGSVSVTLEETIAANLELAVDSIDLDAWLALPVVQRAIPKAPVSKQKEAKDGEVSKSVSLTMPAKLENAQPDEEAGVIPTNIEAILNFQASTLTVNGGLIRQARLNAELAGGEVTISQLSAQLPGSADVALFGFVVPNEGKPQFDGEMEVAVGDLRGVLGWLGVPAPPVPSDRLRKMTLAGKVSATAKALTATDLDMQFDSSRLTGKTVLQLNERPNIDAQLVLDRINLDAYLKGNGTVSAPPPVAQKPAGEETTSEDATAEKKEAEANPFAALNALQNFDANIQSQIKTLVYGGAQVKNAVFNAELMQGALNLSRVSVDKLAGSSFKASGLIKNLGGIPEMQNLHLAAKATDLSRLFRLAGADAPLDPKKLGSVSFAGTLNGSALNPLVDLSLKGAGASIAAEGKVSVLPIVGGFTGKLKVVHSDVVKMLRALGIDYRPGGRLGGLNLSSDVQADMNGMTLNNLSGVLGPVNLNGTAKVSLSGPRTKISSNLGTSKIVVDRFLPVTKGAFWIEETGPIPANLVTPGKPGVSVPFKRQIAISPGRWPTDPIDLSVLKSFDADIKVKSEALVYGNYTVNKADIVAVVNDGTLQVNKLTGGLFGGAIDAKATVKAASPSSIETVVALSNLNVAQGLMAVIGESPAGGKAAMNISLNSSGFTVADLMAALGGKGNLALNGLDVSKSGKGTALSAALGLVAGLNNLGGALTGKKAGGGLADITGSFNINKGVARSTDLTLKSSMGNGRAQGNIDLSRWLIDVAGQVEMSQNVLGLILSQGQTAPSILPFSIKGNLDAPNVKLDTSKLQGAGIPIPGLDKVLKKKGVGNLLQNILPGFGGSTGSQPTAPPPPSTGESSSGSTPPPPPPSQPQKIEPKDLIKGLLKGLGG